MGMTETKFEEKCCDLAKFYGWHHRKLKWIGRRGAADRLFLKDGRAVFVEFKRPDGTGSLSANQEREIQKLRDAGAEVWVVDSYVEFREALGIVNDARD